MKMTISSRTYSYYIHCGRQFTFDIFNIKSGPFIWCTGRST